MCTDAHYKFEENRFEYQSATLKEAVYLNVDKADLHHLSVFNVDNRLYKECDYYSIGKVSL
ncbi:hypothetical protein DPMN_173419 [Dreissena polymorpha]|uniref:Uncharacterized protein n=1 Tax=Dreissena polymorpha TaxID=45954 RepID=A0A9D4IG26_DREPO|nr:hypothetical protein DPMN_173419 [Dreissena polymorpha]